MTTYDLVIRNAVLVDGTGSAGRPGALAVSGDRIAAVGAVDGPARREIDARGQVLAPGFIDIHTHYDPQICWDRLATPSLEHGCTTIVMGNCSLSLAPVRKGQERKLLKMFEKIEDIGERTFAAGVPWSWESFGDYLDHIRPGLGINVGALVGHSALRYYVMGPASQERAATPAEIDRMSSLLIDAMKAGAIGLSTSYVDIDENERPVPSRYAALDEKIALAKAMVSTGRGVLQTVPFFIDPERQLANIAELGEISRASGATCSLAPLIFSPISDLWKRSLAALEAEQAKGAKVLAQSMPRTFDLNIRLSETSFVLYGAPAWNALMKKPLADRIKAFADPANRPALMKDAALIQQILMFLKIGATVAPANAGYAGRLLAEVAKERGQEPAEALIDIALADDLQTEYQVKGIIHADPERVAEILSHPLVHIGASDAGAHISQFCGAGDTAYLFERFVRGDKRMGLERAVHRLTGELARDWGIADRGELKVGKFADLVLFDPATIARGDERFVSDVPGNANRYVRAAEGISLVAVNGAVVVEDKRYTDARAGRVI